MIHYEEALYQVYAKKHIYCNKNETDVMIQLYMTYTEQHHKSWDKMI